MDETRSAIISFKSSLMLLCSASVIQFVLCRLFSHILVSLASFSEM